MVIEKLKLFKSMFVWPLTKHQPYMLIFDIPVLMQHFYTT